jgi:hypothetical protein
MMTRLHLLSMVCRWGRLYLPLQKIAFLSDNMLRALHNNRDNIMRDVR